MIDEILIQPDDTIRLILPEYMKNYSTGRIEEFIQESNEKFEINNKEDASKLDLQLGLFVRKYSKKIDLSKIEDKHFSEKEGYDLYTDKTNRSIRLLSNCIYQYDATDALPLDILYEKYPEFSQFRYFLDAKINFANCSARAFELLASHYNNKGLNERVKYYTFMSSRIETQSIAQALVIGIRALWDKIMNIIVLEKFGEEDLKKFDNDSRRSKKKYFKNHYNKNNEYDEMIEVIEHLDDNYRTGEVHKTGGKIRNSSLSSGTITDRSLLEILGHYNYVHQFLDNRFNYIFCPNPDKIAKENLCNNNLEEAKKELKEQGK